MECTRTLSPASCSSCRILQMHIPLPFTSVLPDRPQAAPYFVQPPTHPQPQVHLPLQPQHGSPEHLRAAALLPLPGGPRSSTTMREGRLARPGGQNSSAAVTTRGGMAC